MFLEIWLVREQLKYDRGGNSEIHIFSITKVNAQSAGQVRPTHLYKEKHSCLSRILLRILPIKLAEKMLEATCLGGITNTTEYHCHPRSNQATA